MKQKQYKKVIEWANDAWQLWIPIGMAALVIGGGLLGLKGALIIGGVFLLTTLVVFIIHNDEIRRVYWVEVKKRK
jgi:hypothetical protein